MQLSAEHIEYAQIIDCTCTCILNILFIVGFTVWYFTFHSFFVSLLFEFSTFFGLTSFSNRCTGDVVWRCNVCYEFNKTKFTEHNTDVQFSRRTQIWCKVNSCVLHTHTDARERTFHLYLAFFFVVGSRSTSLN